MTNKSNGKKRVIHILIGLLIVIGLCSISIGGYVFYICHSYYRLDDQQILDAQNINDHLITNTQDLSIVTANIGFGAYSSQYRYFLDSGDTLDYFFDRGYRGTAENNNSVINNIFGEANSILEKKPDFVLLQELDTDGTRSKHINEYDMFRNLFNTYNSVFAQTYDSPWMIFPLYDQSGANKSGLATFSKYNINDSTRYSLPIADDFNKFLDLDRCFSVSHFKVKNTSKELVVINIHASAYGVDPDMLKAQAHKYLSLAREEYSKGNAVIIGGDFNQIMTTAGEDSSFSWATRYPFDILEDFSCVTQYSDFNTARNAGKIYGGDDEQFLIDSFIISPNINVKNLEVIDTDYLYSDHKPLYMTFDVNFA